jgi:hypothetical protein
MRTLIVGLGLSAIPCFAFTGSGGGSDASLFKLAATFVGIVLAAMLRAWLFGEKKSK